jgi:hypothetical protein
MTSSFSSSSPPPPLLPPLLWIQFPPHREQKSSRLHYEENLSELHAEIIVQFQDLIIRFATSACPHAMTRLALARFL